MPWPLIGILVTTKFPPIFSNNFRFNLAFLKKREESYILLEMYRNKYNLLETSH